MSLKKDLKEILEEAESQGWRCELQKSGHWRLYAPDGVNIVTTGSTPTDPPRYVTWSRRCGDMVSVGRGAEMEYRLTITIPQHGWAEEHADRLLDGFLATHPEAGPVVGQDLEAATLTVVFSLEAENVYEAFERGREVFADGATASGLSSPDGPVSASVEEVGDEEVARTSERELEPA